MPFGLTNAPATFQQLIDSVIAGLKWTVCLVYLDDIIIFSQTFEEHLNKLTLVFDRLREANLKLKGSKCRFCLPEVQFLGHTVGPEGIRPDPEKVKAVHEFPQPQNLRQLQSFLGLTSYYRKFMKDYAKIAHPLTAL